MTFEQGCKKYAIEDVTTQATDDISQEISKSAYIALVLSGLSAEESGSEIGLGKS